MPVKCRYGKFCSGILLRVLFLWDFFNFTNDDGSEKVGYEKGDCHECNDECGIRPAYADRKNDPVYGKQDGQRLCDKDGYPQWFGWCGVVEMIFVACQKYGQVAAKG